MRIAVFFTPPENHPLDPRRRRLARPRCLFRRRADAGAGSGFETGEIDALTADPRRYGFHATLKPPFRIADGPQS